MAASTIGSLAQVNDTYYYSIEVNLETIKCKMCPPGTYWKQHCTQDGGEARCEDCDDGRFTENYNRAIYCKRCTECTGTDQPSGEAVAEPCTRFHDTICECKPGYWREEGKVGACQKVLPCEPGYGMIKLGGSHNDTTCERCVNGKSFSNISSEVTPCQNCSLCLEGWVQKTPCNEYEDIVCIPKDVKNYRYDVIVGATCGVIVAIVLVIIIVYCLRKKNHQCSHCSKRKGPHHDAAVHDEEQGNRLQEDKEIEMCPVNTHQDNVDTPFCEC